MAELGLQSPHWFLEHYSFNKPCGFHFHLYSYVLLYAFCNVDSGKSSICPQMASRERWIGWAQSILGAVKMLCMTLQWWIHVIVLLSKPIACTIPKVSPKLIDFGWFWFVDTGLFWLKMYHLVRHADNGETVWGRRVYTGSPCALLSVLRKT